MREVVVAFAWLLLAPCLASQVLLDRFTVASPPTNPAFPLREAQAIDPDVAYDPVEQRFLVVWTDVIPNSTVRPLSQYVVRGQFYDANGGVVGPRFRLGGGPQFLEIGTPRVVYVRDSGSFLVAFRRGRDLFGYRISSPTSISTEVRLVRAGTGVTIDEFDLGGGPGASSLKAEIVWIENGSSVQGRDLTVFAPGGSIPMLIGLGTIRRLETAPAGHRVSEIVISKNTDSGRRWLAAWTQIQGGVAGSADVIGHAIVSSNGIPSGVRLPLFDVPATDESECAVAADDDGAFYALCRQGASIWGKSIIAGTPPPAAFDIVDPGSPAYVVDDPNVVWVNNRFMALWTRNSRLVGRRIGDPCPIVSLDIGLHANDHNLSSAAAPGIGQVLVCGQTDLFNFITNISVAASLVGAVSVAVYDFDDSESTLQLTSTTTPDLTLTLTGAMPSSIAAAVVDTVAHPSLIPGIGTVVPRLSTAFVSSVLSDGSGAARLLLDLVGCGDFQPHLIQGVAFEAATSALRTSNTVLIADTLPVADIDLSNGAPHGTAPPGFTSRLFQIDVLAHAFPGQDWPSGSFQVVHYLAVSPAGSQVGVPAAGCQNYARCEELVEVEGVQRWLSLAATTTNPVRIVVDVDPPHRPLNRSAALRVVSPIGQIPIVNVWTTLGDDPGTVLGHGRKLGM